ncbi:MAG: bifunctional metallophosphatase/5'-nucleotidase [Eubacteriaceae bacterium]
MNMKKPLSIFFLVFMIFFTLTFPVLAATENPDGSVTLKIIHTNDIHARYDYSPGKAIGFSRLKTIKNQENPDLTVDAGDLFHGLSFATIETGGSIAEIIASIGYDAMAPGNHDFNYGSSRLKTLGDMAGTSILGANVVETTSGSDFFNDPFLIKSISLSNGDPIKIGVFGLISPDIYSGTAPANVAGLSFGSDPSIIQTAQTTVDELKALGCDVVIALMHVGDSTNGILRSDTIAMNVPGIDVIIDGHTHDLENTLVNNTLIVQTGKYFENVGLLELNLTKNNPSYVVSAKSETLISANDAALISSDPGTDSLIQAIKDRQEPILNEVVGETPVTLDWSWEKIRTQELNLGRVVTDSYRFVANADIGIDSAGGIRSQILAGPITKGNVIDVLPFGNYLVTKEISGADIVAMLEKSLQVQIENNEANNVVGSSWPSNSGSVLQWSGICGNYDLARPFGERILQETLYVGEEPFNPARLYVVAASNFLGTSDDYPPYRDAEIINEYSSCDEALITYFQNASQERFLTAVNIPNLTPWNPVPEPPFPIPIPKPNNPEGKASSSNPKTGYPNRFQFFEIKF